MHSIQYVYVEYDPAKQPPKVAAGKQQPPAKDSNKSVPLPEFERGLKVEYFRSFPRPLSGRGPATVSSQSLSSKLMVQVRESAHVKGRRGGGAKKEDLRPIR
ncbi:hypothetical protein HAX54_029744 [Datura stramonium]|uniref:Uncharacterized protein n=1 Tax=Datura stramonium TaxID=4076 RepID=A0ABS8SAD7_DATST|nr:hypothetical protein [Datura stramonium]